MTIADQLRRSLCPSFGNYVARKPQSCMAGSTCNCTDLKDAADELDRLASALSNVRMECDKWKHAFDVANTSDHEAIAADRAVQHALGRAEGADALIAYLDALLVSGNSIPVERPWFTAESWAVVKDYVRHGLPLDHDRIEIERIYRQKTAAGLRAFSPLAEALEARK